MLLVVSFGLVLVATVLLVLGLVTDGGLGLIYGSITMSVVAAVLLFVSARSAPQGQAKAKARAQGSRRLAPVPTGERDGEAGADTGEVAVDARSARQSTEAAAVVESDPARLPIADYDDLHEYEILPIIAELSVRDLGAVEAYERAGAARPEILEALAGRRRETVSPPPWVKQPAGDHDDDRDRADAARRSPWAPDTNEANDAERQLLGAPSSVKVVEAEAVGVPDGAGRATRRPAARHLEPVESVDSAEPTPPVAPSKPKLAPAPASASTAGRSAKGPARTRVRVNLPLPIAGYDEMTVSQIVALLGGLEIAELERLAAHESANRGRRTVLASIDRHLGRRSSANPERGRTASHSGPTTDVSPAKRVAGTKATPAKAAADAASGKAAKAASSARKASAPTGKRAASTRQASGTAKASPATAERAPSKRAADTSRTSATSAENGQLWS